MMGFTDLHAHFLYGLDDGADSREEMERMLDAAYCDGISVLVATPHSAPGLERLDFEQVQLKLKEAKEYCTRKGYPIQLYAGSEVLYTPLLGPNIQNRILPRLGHTELTLVEFPADADYAEIIGGVEQLNRAGCSVMIAHIDRCGCLFYGNRVKKLKEKHDVLLQMNASAIIYGRGIFRNFHIWKWIRNGLVDCIASDAHNCTSRPFCMRKVYSILSRKVGVDRANQLCKRDFSTL